MATRYDDILNGIQEWKDIKPGEWSAWELPNIPILRSKLPKPAYDFVWDRIEEAQENYKSVKNTLVGNITESLELEDKNDYFFKNILKGPAENYVQTFPTMCSRNVFNDCRLTDLYLKSLWVNFSQKHEFNPVHDHNGVLSFVLWMKIPTKWQEQYELDISKDTNFMCASSFQFFYQNIFGQTRGVVVEMDEYMEGCILMFPSSLQHMVHPFYQNDGYRISVSGNLCYDINKMPTLQNLPKDRGIMKRI